MKHTFDVEIAAEYGVNCAIILDNIYYWIMKNKANQKHLHDGMYWTYNSIKAFLELFPYMTRDKVIGALKKLADNGLIVEGNYNDLAFDRTKWYAITEKGMAVIENHDFDFGKDVTPFTENPKCIDIYNNIYNTTDSKPDINLIDSNESICQTSVNAVQQAVNEWNNLEPFGVPPVKRIAPSSTRYKMMNARISEYGLDEVLKTIRMVKDCDFLLGRTSHAFVVDFEWFVKPNNFPKVNEGKYLNKDAIVQYANVDPETELAEYADYK